MNQALRKGEHDLSGKENAPQREPGGVNKSLHPGPDYIATPPADKVERTARLRRRGRYVDHVDQYGVIHRSTEPEFEDQKARDRAKAAAARAGLVLGEMRKLLHWQGVHCPRPEDQELWLEVAIAQYNLIRGSRPRWTLGLHRWVKRYAPDVYRARSMGWIDGRVEDQRREGKFFTAAEIGRMLQVPREAYAANRFQAIWPDGMTPDEREADKRARKAAWQRGKNLKTKKVRRPHSQSISATQPWLAAGFKTRRTWERHGKPEAPSR